MADLDTKLFRSFAAVAAERSFSLGGRRLGYSQATMSMRVRALEEKLGVRLLDRGPRDVKLTAAGRSLMPEVRALLDAHDRMVARLSSAPDVAKVRLGVAEGYVASLLPDLMQESRKKRLGPQLDILCGTSSELHRMIAANRLDLAILTLPGSSASGWDLCRLQMHWVASPGFALDFQAPLPVAWHDKDCHFRISGTAALEVGGFDYREVLLGSDERIVAAAVEAGTAITVMAEGTVPPPLEILFPDSGLPTLGAASVRLLERPGPQSDAAQEVKRNLLRTFRGALEQRA